MVPSSAADAAVLHAASEWVVFSCDGHLFGVPLSRTREILDPRPITRLPGCGRAVCGLIGIRGRVVTAFDLGEILLGKPSSDREEHRVLVLQSAGKRVAVLVDAVVSMARETESMLPIDRVSLEALGTGVDDVVGIGTLDDQPFVALDPDKILGRLLT
jgi:chemotaxis signal transduction protein